MGFAVRQAQFEMWHFPQLSDLGQLFNPGTKGIIVPTSCDCGISYVNTCKLQGSPWWWSVLPPAAAIGGAERLPKQGNHDPMCWTCPRSENAPQKRTHRRQRRWRSWSRMVAQWWEEETRWPSKARPTRTVRAETPWEGEGAVMDLQVLFQVPKCWYQSRILENPFWGRQQK